MELIIYLYAFFTWVILALLASLNGWVRNKFYKKKLDELTAHQLSTIIFIGMLFFVTYFFIKWSEIKNSVELWTIGIAWFFITILFEFIFGHYVWKHPWNKLLYDYNLMEGRIWILVLIATLIAPYIVYILM